MRPLERYRAELEAELAALDATGSRRSLRPPQGIDLVSNDYLGLADHPRLVEAMRAALPRLGAGSGGSRLLRGHRLAFDELEARLAEVCGAEAALLFGSGYAANVGLLTALLSRGDHVLSDERNHASLIDGMRLSGAGKTVYRHLDLEALAAGLRAPVAGRRFVVTESVFSMDGDCAPLVAIAEIAEANGALLIVDEAHSTGLYGARGSGLVEALGLRDRVLATVHTGGKALGSAGAWVAGLAVLRDALVNRARPFIFSTAPLPVLCAALHAGLDLIADEPERRTGVHEKATLLRLALQEVGADTGGSASPIVPVIVGGNQRAVALAAGLVAEGFDVRAVRPPTVAPGTARLRVTARYPVPDDDLRRFASAAGRLLEATVGSLARV